jgi:serine/threonine protein kinase/tetratricopeptide (TPR) repeat protein
MSDAAEREAEIFAEAVILPAAERARYLEVACVGDPELRQRIEALILAHESSDTFMTTPAGASLGIGRTESRPPEDQPGTRIGRYKLLQHLGEGGCGVVWMAEQEEPVRRRVAVKVIKLGMDTKSVIARFEAERQALALMDHPNIARVLDAGATEAGRPYFVMELVPGVPITRFCDQHNLPTSERLRLFAQVCHAVQHAHQKGVIHRDLKPSNILVSHHDGEPVPKVIDFGIAKATQGRLTDQTLFTALEQFIGTPAYMSPEQAEMGGLDVDTRSDIYSLGVLLYELLTGRPPFDPKSLVQAGLDEIRRIIREVEPPKPSTRLNTLTGPDRDSIARQRGTAPGQLSLLLRGDLDWIVMKALDKKRSRRYETANGLAIDIQRHLQHEPVMARPPTAWYRVSRFIRRNRVAFTATSAVALALIAGTIVSTLEAVRARRAERVAAAERTKAQEERTRAENLLGFMLGDLRTQLAKVGRLEVLDSVGEKAMAYFSSREAGGLDDATLTRYSQALSQIGQIRVDQARYPDALTAFSDAYARASTLATRHPQDGDVLFERGQAEYWIGFVHWRRGELTLAAEWLKHYHDTSAQLVALDATRPEWQSELAYGNHNLAVLNKERGEFAAAQSGFRAELATLEKMNTAAAANLELRYRIADAHSWLGGLAVQNGALAEALNEYASQAARLEELVSSEPRNPRWRFRLAEARLYQTEVLLATGRYADAQEALDKARGLFDELVLFDTSNRRWQGASQRAHLLRATLLRQRGDQAGATREIVDTRQKLEALTSAEPSDRMLARWTAWAYRLEAQQLDLKGDRPAALIAATRAFDTSEKLIRDAHATDADVAECAIAAFVVGEIALRTGDHAKATSYWEKVPQLLKDRLSGSRDFRFLDPAARAAIRLGRTEVADALIAQLNKLGYVPLDPWPEIKRADGSQPPTPNG